MSGGHNRKFMADPAGYARDKVILLPVHEKKGFWDEITGAGTDKRVAGLVYIAAVVPDVQETVQSQLNKYPTEIFSQIEVAGGRVWIKPEGVKYFAGDLSEQEQTLVWATSSETHQRDHGRDRQQPRHNGCRGQSGR